MDLASFVTDSGSIFRDFNSNFMMNRDDSGPSCRGTLWTGIAHAFTATIGSGILALPWCMGQLGWILGPFVLVSFAAITYYTAIHLCDCYRTPDPVNGRRNYNYMGAVRALLGPRNVLICGIIQYSNLWGSMIGYTITTVISMAALKRSISCFHEKGRSARCDVSANKYMLLYGAFEVILSQCPNLEKAAFLSVVAAVTSLLYSFIVIGLSTAKLISSHFDFKGSLMVAHQSSMDMDMPSSTKIWHVFQAFGNLAFAFNYTTLLLEIQVYAQPVFAVHERWLGSTWPTSFLNRIHTIKITFIHNFTIHFTPGRLLLRSIFVTFTTLVAMIFPFFNAVLGFIGALSFWPLTVYFPLTMYTVQANIKRGSSTWIVFQVLGLVSMVVTLIAAVGSIADILENSKHAKLFHIDQL
ncbi:hypothetical protein LWI29_014180 [Acer saccharum]|uniref:Amino acid transporter transmembrane domain-containing protein n=1 Tax=Acer saccharum TaxID=4024 RepID=A0AA39W6D2_ACESA|nr:hypothetical protein LWI29_014180 [Acer saccharum]